MPRPIVVGSFEFDVMIPGQGKNIPATMIGGLNFPNGTRSSSMLWTIPAGSPFYPEEHAHAHLLIVIEGQGTFYNNGKEFPYTVGSVLEVKEYDPNYFIRVD